MIPRLSDIYGVSATSIGSCMLDSAGALLQSPKRSRSAALAAAFPALLAEARAIQDRQAASLGAVAQAADDRKARIAAVRAAEELLDAAFAGLCARLTAEARERAPGARDLRRFLFPRGSYSLTRLKGVAAFGAYQAWLRSAASEEATRNPAYAAVAGKVDAFRARFEDFEAKIHARSGAERALTLARSERDEAQAAWTEGFRDLIGVAAVVYGAESDAFARWLAPLLDKRAAQKAARTRRANAVVDSASGG